ncbi:hypothetical protein [Rufibacter sp. LB8]|uniref:hypothetical protein n=2 Tax=Rufibacter sp. LB8 TaxID=2777781 RepID=UPI00178C7D5E|nr:hypothetical protein [Rufibacter sp. LB8]
MKFSRIADIAGTRQKPLPTTKIELCMNAKHVLILLAMAALDIFVFTEVVSLLRATSDSAVLLGVMFLVLLMTLNYFVVKLILANSRKK